MSEDALNALYLGIPEGKNEIDSSFDHIIKIPPVDCKLGEKICEAYIKRHYVGSDNVDSKLYRCIAAVSFGVPRDIIRRSDELLARKNLHKDIAFVPDNLRKIQIKIAFSEKIISKIEQNKF